MSEAPTRILVVNPNSNEAVTRGLDAALEPLRFANGPEIVCSLTPPDEVAEKVARLRAWAAQRFGVDVPFELWAYGDSACDDELLALADHPTWVGRRAGRQG